MMGYSSLSRFYDRFTNDIDYSELVSFTIDQYKKYNHDIPGIALDLACGTGSLSIEFSKRNIETIGIDISSDMLSIAYMKNISSGTNVLFLEQDMCDFELYGTVDLIVCYFDSINHILDQNKLKNLFKLAYNYLESGGIFIFDVNTLYCFENIYAQNVYYESYEDLEYIWQNAYDKVSGSVEFFISVFEKGTDGRYSKFEDVIKEKYYSDDILKEMSYEYFELMSVNDGFTSNSLRDDSQRSLYVLKKREHLFK